MELVFAASACQGQTCINICAHHSQAQEAIYLSTLHAIGKQSSCTYKFFCAHQQELAFHVNEECLRRNYIKNMEITKAVRQSKCFDCHKIYKAEPLTASGTRKTCSHEASKSCFCG